VQRLQRPFLDVSSRLGNRTASDDPRLTGKKSLIPVLTFFSERNHLLMAITEDPVRSLRAKRHSSMSLEVAIVADVVSEKSLLSCGIWERSEKVNLRIL
jgi:hypothetical protein